MLANLFARSKRYLCHLSGVLSLYFSGKKQQPQSAILLSKFTLDYKDLVIAVNIGSLGTLISH